MYVLYIALYIVHDDGCICRYTVGVYTGPNQQHMHASKQLKFLLKNVTGFGKTCIVHTSDFEYLDIYKNHSEQYTELKLPGQLEE